MSTLPIRAKLHHDAEHLAARLQRKFGGGRDPTRRRLLYARLERECEEFGSEPYRIIADCVAGAMSAKHPDRWFCAAVCRRLREAGFLERGRDVDF